MKFVVKKLECVEKDALPAAEWYDEQQSGLGDDFLDQAESAVQALASEAFYRIRFADVRRAPICRFKFYGIYYLIKDSDVWVIAIQHGCQHPRWLRQRRSETKRPMSNGSSQRKRPNHTRDETFKLKFWAADLCGKRECCVLLH